MRIENPNVHSLENLARDEQACLGGSLPLGEAVPLMVRLHSQGHPATMSLITALKQQVQDEDGQRFVVNHERSYEVLSRSFRLEDLDSGWRKTFYRREGSIYLKNKGNSRKLLVIFTTLYNNFYYSNAAMAAMLSGLDCDLLFLKDPTYFSFINGASGIATDFPGVGNHILEMAQRNEIEKIYVAAYSGGGYAALLTSLRIKSSGFLGFSIPIDCRADSPFFAESYRYIVPKLDPEWLLDLKPLLASADPAVPRVLYYGDANAIDLGHARHVEGLPSIRTICLPGVDHMTVNALSMTDQLLAAFATLIDGRSDWPVPDAPHSPTAKQG